jgi:putative tricarboxylic transport membrane protein
MMWQASGWQFGAKLVPVVVGAIAIITLAASLLNNVFRRPALIKVVGLDGEAKHQVEQKIHMDIDSGTDHLPTRTILARAAMFFGYLVGFMAVMAVIGLIPTAFIFVILFMRLEGRERWKLTLTYAACMVVFITIVFDKLLALPWPSTLVGGMFPALAKLIPSM